MSSQATALAPTVAAVPPPERLRAELIALYKAVRLTRSLLKISERLHSQPTTQTTDRGPAHASAR